MAHRPHLFLADPWHTLEHDTESTLILARAAEERGIACHWATPEQISYTQNQIMVHAPQPLAAGAANLKSALKDLPLSYYAGVHWRCDPPVTLSIMRLWALLSAVPSPKTRFYNSPQSLLLWNEKYTALRFPSWSVPTVVASTRELLVSGYTHLTSHDSTAILKTAGDAASRGVQLISSKVQMAAADLRPLGPWPVVQKFLPEILKGETRIFLINGKIAGTLKKTPQTHSPIMDWDHDTHKPVVTQAKPTATQRSRALTLGRLLKKDGVHFATIDFIGQLVLEVNITSPGLLYGLGSKGCQKAVALYWQAASKS